MGPRAKLEAGSWKACLDTATLSRLCSPFPDPHAHISSHILPILAPVPSLWNAGTGFSPSSSSACSLMLTWLTRWENRARVKAMAALYCLDPKARKSQVGIRGPGPRTLRRWRHQ